MFQDPSLSFIFNSSAIPLPVAVSNEQQQMTQWNQIMIQKVVALSVSLLSSFSCSLSMFFR
jgi:hypothetical protein